MANFMGPMAPPQAAPGQPPQLDIRTNPNQRQRFRNFMRQNTRPAGMTGVPPMYPAAQTPFPAAPMPPMPMPAPAPIMPMQMAQPMQPPMAQPMGPARNVDIFSPQYMQAQPPVGMEDGGAVPPRRTEIKGQDHMLAYITPKEAGILKALGGSGEAGPMGIPSYPEDSSPSVGGSGYDGGGSSSSSSSGSDKGGDKDFGMSPGRSQAQFGTSEFAGMSEQDAKDALAGGGGSDQAQAIQAALATQAKAEAERAFAQQAARTRPQVNLTTVENPQQTQDLLDVFSMSTTPVATDETQTNAIQSTYSPTAKDTLAAISDMLGLENDLLADTQSMTDRQALARSAPAVDVVSAKAAPSDVFGMDDEYDEVVGTPDYDDPNRPGYKDGLPTGLEFADTKRGRFTTNLAGLTEAQRAAMPGYMSPENKTGIVAGLMDMIGVDPSKSAYGYEIDDTGKVTGMVGPSQMPSFGPLSAIANMITSQFTSTPETTEDLLNSSVYTGYGQGSMANDLGGDGPNPIIYPPLTPEEEAQAVVGNVMGGMDTPYVAPPSLPSPLVPSTRQAGPMNFVQPVGYGSVPTGTINPYAYLSAGFPVGAQFFADGGEVLDQAAGRFLEALTAA